MKEDNVYRKLAERWDYANSERFLRILETILTPDECKLLLNLPAPTPERLAKRLNRDEESVKTKLHELARRGLLIIGKRGYVVPQTVASLHDTTLESGEEYIPPEVYDLWKDFYYAEWRKDLAVRELPVGAAGGGFSPRVMPAWKAIQASPDIRPEDILPCETLREVMKQILEREKLAVVHCPCRRGLRECDRPLEVCLQPKGRAEYQINRGAAKGELSLEEAIAIMDSAEEAGLVHMVNNNVIPRGVMCNCCSCCCIMLNPILTHGRGKLREVVAPSRFKAVVDRELCTGCQDCVEPCPFGAIAMQKLSNFRKMKAVVNDDQCMGCGVCVIKCPAEALTFELVRPPEHIPSLAFDSQSY
jgi:Na+-translocating ferredoxin:NAD+ oxidoreductase RNF subunit RnfB